MSTRCSASTCTKGTCIACFWHGMECLFTTETDDAVFANELTDLWVFFFSAHLKQCSEVLIFLNVDVERMTMNYFFFLLRLFPRMTHGMLSVM